MGAHTVKAWLKEMKLRLALSMHHFTHLPMFTFGASLEMTCSTAVHPLSSHNSTFMSILPRNQHFLPHSLSHATTFRDPRELLLYYYRNRWHTSKYLGVSVLLSTSLTFESCSQKANATTAAPLALGAVYLYGGTTLLRN